jgi:nicastrin
VTSTVPGLSLDPNRLTPSDTPGLPPSPLLAFVEQTPALPAIALADHHTTYTNTYYHSQFDDSTNTRGAAHICAVATLAARALYVSAGGTVANASALVHADCNLVSTLYECMTQNWACPLVNQYLGTSGMCRARVSDRSIVGSLSSIPFLAAIQIRP